MRSAPRAVWSVALLAAWLGAAVITAAVVAPAAFAVLPSRTMAGAVVGRVLPVLFVAGMALGVVVAAMSASSGAGRVATASASALAAACLVAQLVVAPRITSIRESIGVPVDALDPSDPRRQAFGRLHAQSVGWLALAGIAAVVALVVFARLLTARTPA